jgi:acetyl-CoA carboxylase biotin carboxyl carrier protein
LVQEDQRDYYCVPEAQSKEFFAEAGPIVEHYVLDKVRCWGVINKAFRRGLAPSCQATQKERISGGQEMPEVVAPMGGNVWEVKVKVGDQVNEGDEVVILEAMKMELPIVAEASGVVKEVKVKKGDAVETGAVLVVIE